MNYKNSTKIFNINVVLFSILISFTMFYVFEATKSIGLLFVSITLMMAVLYFFTQLNQIRVNQIFFTWSIYALYGLLVLICNFSISGAETCMKQIFMLFFVTILSQNSINNHTLDKMSKCFAFLYYVIIVSVLVNEFVFRIYGSEQFLYKMVIICLFFVIVRTKRVYLYSTITMAVLFITSTRSAILTIMLFLIIYKCLGLIKKSKLLYNATFWVGFFLIISIPIMYVALFKSDMGLIINNYSRELFGKNFFSGRQVIWDAAFSYIVKSPVFGHGFSNRVLENNDIFVSTHNLFLNLMLQGGFILLFIFVFFMYSLWKRYYKNIENRVVKLSAAFLLPVLLRAGFDLILLENDLVISIFLWVPLIIGIMFSKHKETLDKKTNNF